MFLIWEILTILQLGLCLHMLHSKVVKWNTKVRLDVVSSFDRSCQCNRKESTDTFTLEPNLFNFQLSTSVDEELVKQRLASAVTSGIRGPTAPDILSASYFDIAVLRCLFSLHWSEDGVFWALKYVHQRLLEVCDEYLRRDYSERERSHSLPFQDFKLLRSQTIPLHGVEKSKAKLGIKKPSSRLETIPSAGEISPALDRSCACHVWQINIKNGLP